MRKRKSKLNKKSQNGNPTLTGVLKTTPRNGGFIIDEKSEKKVEIAKEYLKTAVWGDTVQVELITSSNAKELRGRVKKIVYRKTKSFVGTVIQKDGKKFVQPDNYRLRRNINIPKNSKVKKDTKVLVLINDWQKFSGTIEKELGKKGEHEVEMQSIILDRGLDQEFPKEVEKEAQRIKREYQADEKNRLDIRNIPLFTIDPESAKDFDDALSVEKVGENFKVGVHIADVSHFVKEGSSIDKEAKERGTSVYLVDRTIPMLPEVLSNDLCSLNPEEDKYAFSAIFTMNKESEVKNVEFRKTLICSQKRFTYEEAQEIIDSESGPFSEELLILRDLAQKLRKKREKDGSIDFDTEEVGFKLDKDGKVISIYKKPRLDTHKLVEDFMLLANRHVAHFMYEKQKEYNQSGLQPSVIYRVHQSPDPAKMETLSIFLRALGYECTLDKQEDITPKDISAMLKKAEGKAQEGLIKTAILRSMSKAIYSTKNVGHFGLAFQYYTHFTSPIRRYPDLLVHRLLYKYISKEKVESGELARYQKMAEDASEKEIAAAEAERESVKLKQVEYMSEHIGEQFVGRVSGVTEWGLYLEENETKSEGMVHVKNLGNDYFELDEKTYSLVGKKTGKRYSLGDELKFEVVSADLEKKNLDYKIISS